MEYQTYNIQAVLDLKCTIESDIDLVSYVGWTMESETYAGFIEDLKKVVPHGITRETLISSTVDLLNKELTIDGLEYLSWRIAGNVHRLKSGSPVPAWTRQRFDEWVPVIVTEAYPEKSRFGKPIVKMSMRVLAGTPASKLLQATWSRKFCQVVCRDIGFSAPWGKYPFKDPREFVGLRMTVQISKELSTDVPVFDKIRDDETASIIKYNRKMITSRRRQPESGFTCPEGYDHPCQLCPVGYDRCPVGTHSATYEQKYCINCKQDNWFNPAKKHRFCIDCSTGESIKSEQV